MKKTIAILVFGIIFVLAACGSNSNDAVAPSPMQAIALDSVALMDAGSGDGAWVMMPPPATESWAYSADTAVFGEMAAVEVQRNIETETMEVAVQHMTDTRGTTERRRVIRNAQIDMETYDFEDVMDSLRDIPQSVGGYIERSSMSTSNRPTGVGQTSQRTFNIVMRVPEEQFDEIVRQIERLATVTTSRQSAQDVTDQFYDMQTRLDTLRIEEERLLYLIEQAETLSEILNLEQRLSAVRLQMGRYQSSLNNMIQQTTYSTINVVLWELLEDEEEEEEEYIAPPTFGDRIGGAFASSMNGTMWALQEFFVLFAGVVLPLVILGALGFGVYKAYRRYRSV